jgi:hypothetical protein
MAARQFSCPHCAGLFQVDSSLGGQQVSCPHCGGWIVLPAMTGSPPPNGGISADRAAYPGAPSGGAAAPYGGQEVPLHPPVGMPAGESSNPAGPLPATNQERTLNAAPRVPVQPQAATPAERPLAGPRRPLRPLPVGSPAGSSVAGPERPLGGPAQGPAPQVPRVPVAPARPESPVPSPSPVPSSSMPSSPSSAASGFPPGVLPAGGQRLPMRGPQPPIGTTSGTGTSLPTGAAGGRGPQPSAASASGSGAARPQPGRPIVLPTPAGSYAQLREPSKLVGTGDDAFELRTRTAAEKERWRFRKNLILWTFSLLLLGLTILVLMLLGPL